MASSHFTVPSTHKSTKNNLLRFPRITTTHARAAGHSGTKQHMAAVIPFPKSSTCPTCHKPANETELSSCTTCGQQFCDDKDCDWSCPCSRIADAVERIVTRRLNIGRTP